MHDKDLSPAMALAALLPPARRSETPSSPRLAHTAAYIPELAARIEDDPT